MLTPTCYPTQPYLPPPNRSRSPHPEAINLNGASPGRHERKHRLGVRRFLLRQYYQLVFVIIHVYIRLRQAYHAVANRIYSIYYYHHRTPELIRRDVKGLRKLPKHLSVILTLDDQGRRGAGLERLLNEVADVAAWTASAGIPQLSVYEKTGE
jgi:dehydrodolichyl diphosphate syntase complex subunit NUS1